MSRGRKNRTQKTPKTVHKDNSNNTNTTPKHFPRNDDATRKQTQRNLPKQRLPKHQNRIPISQHTNTKSNNNSRLLQKPTIRKQKTTKTRKKPQKILSILHKFYCTITNTNNSQKTKFHLTWSVRFQTYQELS